MQRRNGLFIVFDGLNGGGKTTQMNKLADYLRSVGVEVHTTKNPWSSRWGTKLREEAAAGRRLPMEAELGHFLLDRKEWVEQILSPALDFGWVVLCDRYYYSTVAYQSARGYDAKTLLDVQQAMFPVPDLALHICVPVSLAQQRLRQRGDELDAYDNADTDVRIKQAFDQIKSPQWKTIDGTKDEDTVHFEIWDLVKQMLNIRHPKF